MEDVKKRLFSKENYNYIERLEKYSKRFDDKLRTCDNGECGPCSSGDWTCSQQMADMQIMFLALNDFSRCVLDSFEERFF